MNRLLLISRSERYSLIAATALSLFARLPVFLPGYSIDDYRLVLGEEVSLIGSMQQGRPIVPMVLALLEFFGIAPNLAMPLSSISLILAHLFAGLVVARAMGVQNNRVVCTTLLSLFCLFPYHAEAFTFRTSCILVAIALFLVFAAFQSSLRSVHSWLFGALAIVTALSIYQSAINYVAIGLLFAGVSKLLFPELNGISFHMVRLKSYLFFGSSVLYSLMIYAINRAYGVQEGRFAVIATAEGFTRRFSEVRAAVYQILASAEPIVPFGPKLLLWSALIVAVGSILSERFRREGSPAMFKSLCVLIFTAISSVILTIGIAMVAKDWWPTPRIFAHGGLALGCFVALGMLAAKGPTKTAVRLVTILCLGAFVSLNQIALTEQLRVNQRDMAMANRIYQDLERRPDFDKIKSVVLSGGRWWYHNSFRSVQGDMNLSAFGASWAKVALLEEVSGVRFQAVSSQVEEQSSKMCAELPSWPDARSITTRDQTAIVCLPRP
jgi:hypothetical protein